MFKCLSMPALESVIGYKRKFSVELDASVVRPYRNGWTMFDTACSGSLFFAAVVCA